MPELGKPETESGFYFVGSVNLFRYDNGTKRLVGENELEPRADRHSVVRPLQHRFNHDETAWWRTEELMRLVSRGVRVPSAVKMKWRVSFPYRDG